MEMNRHDSFHPSSEAPSESMPGDSSRRLEGVSLHRVCGIYRFQHKESGKSYIGSSVDIARRHTRHLYDTAKGSLSNIHRALRAHGVEAFNFGLVELCGRDDLLKREEHYIRLYRSAGVHGYNTISKPITNGYKTPVAQATRERLSVVNKGRKRSDESRARMRQRRHTPETLAKMIGRKLSAEHCASMSKAMTGRKQSEETRAKRREFRQAPEAKAKIRAASFAMWAERRAKRSKGQLLLFDV